MNSRHLRSRDISRKQAGVGRQSSEVGAVSVLVFTELPLLAVKDFEGNPPVWCFQKRESTRGRVWCHYEKRQRGRFLISLFCCLARQSSKNKSHFPQNLYLVCGYTRTNIKTSLHWGGATYPVLLGTSRTHLISAVAVSFYDKVCRNIALREKKPLGCQSHNSRVGL